MSARYPYDESYPYAPSEDQWRLSARDRVLPPARRGRRRLIGTLFVLSLLAAGAYAMQSPEPVVPDWLRKDAFALLGSLERAVRKAIEAPAPQPDAVAATAPAAAAADRPAPPLPPPYAPPSNAAEAPPMPAAEVVVTTAALPPTATARPDESDPAKPAAPSDPLRLRAEAAGLNPELSRALLERLTEADFQNAGAAVAKALSQTPDDGVLVWPLRAKPSAAVFEVRFVPGAPEGCRRYIVGILKDRWTTTAMPVDKCGIARQAQRK